MLNSKAFALSAGIIWGLVIFATTITSTFTGYGKSFLEAYSSLHPGYSISMVGSFIGFVYAFICAFVGVYIVIGLYNRFEKRFRK